MENFTIKFDMNGWILLLDMYLYLYIFFQGTSCGLGKHCDTGKCIKRINSKPQASTPWLREETTTKKPAEVVRPIYTNQMSVCDFFAIFGIRYPNCRS